MNCVLKNGLINYLMWVAVDKNADRKYIFLLIKVNKK